ncbi:hypothetical protein A5708_20125 [Mycobacterium colombiense]|uniref:Uncharacterized protein n=1 Tax=Mycobacterium colombiense TaxID=339268 RepID=A0A1A2Z0X0_9MYCO|nr:hypothetical protein A5708_20125 [Mycobacterium colombiense]
MGRARSAIRRTRHRFNRCVRQLSWRQAHGTATRRRIAFRQVSIEIFKIFGYIAAGFGDTRQGTAGAFRLGGRSFNTLECPFALREIPRRLGAARRLRSFHARLRCTTATGHGSKIEANLSEPHPGPV